MNLSRLNISGDWHNDTGTLEKFSRDMSAYRILPALVVEPQNEEDILNTVQFTRNEGLSIVPRSGGSDLSGASIGPGIILNLKKHLNRLVVIGEETIVQPGMILANLVNQLNAHNLMLPAIPSSSAICALGNQRRKPGRVRFVAGPPPYSAVPFEILPPEQFTAVADYR
jgi:FAD/FMN-containing dehydrogenase